MYSTTTSRLPSWHEHVSAPNLQSYSNGISSYISITVPSWYEIKGKTWRNYRNRTSFCLSMTVQSLCDYLHYISHNYGTELVVGHPSLSNLSKTRHTIVDLTHLDSIRLRSDILYKCLLLQFFNMISSRNKWHRVVINWHWVLQ